MVREVMSLSRDFIKSNDDKKAPEFFSRILAEYNVTNPIPNIAFVTVNHIVRTLPFFLEALSKVGRIAAVISKGKKPADQEVYQDCIKAGIPVTTEITSSKLKEAGVAKKFLQDAIRPNEKFVIIDIGGYFAPCLAELSQDSWVKERLLGIVEDTENGHQDYERTISESDIAFPVISVARSELKETEDFNVGKSVIRAADTILRTDAHTILERFPVIGVLGYGKIGRSIADHLREMNIKNVLLCDINQRLMMRASAKGVEIAEIERVLAESDFIFSATGNKALGEKEFKALKNNVFIASVTSSDKEIDRAGLSGFELVNSRAKDISCYRLAGGKTINLLCDGDAVNFRYGGVNGPFIYSVQSELVVCALTLIRQRNQFTEKRLYEISKADMDTIAPIWATIFDGVQLDDESSRWSFGANQVKYPSVETNSGNCGKKASTVFTLPEVSDYFVGREVIITQIKSHTDSLDQQPIQPYFTVGLGGIGKTEVLLKFGWDFKEQFRGGCIYIASESSINIEATFKALAESLNIEKKLIDESAIEALKLLVYQKLKNRGKTLIVFDDMPCQAELDKWLPKSANGFTSKDFTVLVSSRNQNGWRGKIALLDTQDIQMQQDCISYARKHLECSIKEAETLASSLGYLALALSQAVKFIQVSAISVTEYLDLLNAQDSREDVLLQTARESREDENKRTVLKTWTLSINAVSEKYPNAAKMINLAAWLCPDNIPLDFFTVLEQKKLNRLDLRQQLREYSLVYTVGTNGFRIHHLLQEVIREQQEMQAKIDHLSACISMLNQACRYNRRDLNLLLSVHIHYQSLEGYKPDGVSITTSDFAELMYKFGLLFCDHEKDYAQATKYFEIANKLESVGEPELIFKIKRQLAKVYGFCNKHKEADFLYRQLKGLVAEDELTLELTLDYGWYLWSRMPFNSQDRKQGKEEIESVYKYSEQRPKLHGRCCHYLGNIYAQEALSTQSIITRLEKELQEFPHWQTDNKDRKAREVSSKESTYQELVKKAMEFFEKSLSIKESEGDLSEIVRTSLTMLKLLDKLKINGMQKKVIQKFYEVYTQYLSRLDREQHKALYLEVAREWVALRRNKKPLLECLGLSETVEQILKEEKAKLLQSYNEHSKEYKDFLSLLNKKDIQAGIASFFKPKPESVASSSQASSSFYEPSTVSTPIATDDETAEIEEDRAAKRRKI